MNYKETSVLSQLSADLSDELRLPSFAPGFIQEGKAQLLTVTVNRGTEKKPAPETKVLIRVRWRLPGKLNEEFLNGHRLCPECGAPMHLHGSDTVTLKHLPFEGAVHGTGGETAEDGLLSMHVFRDAAHSLPRR